jgi:hypothetical protein
MMDVIEDPLTTAVVYVDDISDTVLYCAVRVHRVNFLDTCSCLKPI